MKKFISMSLVVVMLFTSFNMISVYAQNSVTISSGNTTKSGEGGTSVSGVDWYRAGKTTFPYWNNSFEMTKDSWGLYNVTVPQSGIYAVSAKIGATQSNSTFSFIVETADNYRAELQLTGPNGDNWGVEYSNFGYIRLEEGENLVKAINGGPGYYIFHNMTFTKVDELSVTVASITDEQTIKRGIDKFEFQFNADINPVSKENVVITDVDGENISLEAELLNGKLIVYLTESLDYEKEYTLKLTGLETTSTSIISLDDIVYRFSTDTKENDTGSATVEIIEKKYDTINKKMIINGVVKSNSGKGISKREVIACDENGQELKKTTSLENGAFEVTIPFVENDNIDTNTDIYKCNLSSEYTSPVEVQIEYITKKYEKTILDKFKTNEVSIVECAFSEHYDELSLTTYISDIDTLDNRNLFFNHFMREFLSADELRTYYSKMLLVETLNQTNSFDVVKSIFENESDCNKIGISYDKISSIMNNKTDFINEYISLEASENLESFYEKINALSEKWLMIEYGKSNVTLSVDNISANSGQEVSIPLTLATEQKDVKELVIEIICDDSSLISLMSFECLTGENDEANIENGKINIVFSEKKDAKDTIGNLKIIAPNLNKVYNLSVSGKVSYEVGDNNVELSCEIIEDEFSLSVALKSQTSGRPVVSGGGSSVSTTRKPLPSANASGKKPSENDVQSSLSSSSLPDETIQSIEKEMCFDDLAEVQWAVNTINELVGKNIISKTEDKKFKPLDSITREEFVKLIVMAIGEQREGIKSDFTDVPAGHWAEGYIGCAEKLGIIYGNNNEFGLNQNISRQDMATIIFRTLKLLGYSAKGDAVQFSDKDEISSYAVEAVATLSELGIINGMGNNYFAPLEVATRAQAAQIIFKMMEVLGI